MINTTDKKDALGQLLYVDSIVVKYGGSKIQFYRVTKCGKRRIFITPLHETKILHIADLPNPKEISINPKSVVNVTKNLIASGHTFSKTFHFN